MAISRPFLGLFFAFFLTAGLSSGQTQQQLAQLDPPDLYFNGWLLAQEADKLIKREKFVDAYAKLRQAKVMFDTIAVNHASFKPDLVKGRQDSTSETMTRIYPKAEAEQKGAPTKTNGFIERDLPQKNLISPIDPVLDRQRQENLEVMQREIEQLRSSLATSTNDRNAKAARNRKLLQELEAERNRMASAPLRSELDALNAEIAGLKRENEAMSIALSRTKIELTNTKKKLGIAREALTASQRKIRELNAIVKEQGQINNRIIKGQQDQIDQLRREMKNKDQVIADANQRLKELDLQFQQARGIISDLQEERNDLIREKEQMANLLDLNEADKLQQLISQNVSLSKQYNEAKRKLDAMTASADASQEDITLAKRGLVIAKAKIRELQSENKRQELQIRDLQNRLETTQQDLLATADGEEMTAEQRAETELLRDLARKKSNALQAQQKKADLLIEQAERMGLKDENWKLAIEQFKGLIDTTLTEDEEAIIADATADYTATNRYQTSAVERQLANAELKRRTNDFKKGAARAFAKEDLHAARGILNMIVEEDPGAWDAMINLGIVNLRMDQPVAAISRFKQAILYAGDRKIPVAHFLLGDAYYREELYPDAHRELQISLSMQSENAKAHVLLGNMAGKQNDPFTAEVHFKEAIQLNPRLWEPHYNLAFLAARDGKKSQGKTHYQEALRLGAPANLPLEKKLGL